MCSRPQPYTLQFHESASSSYGSSAQYLNSQGILSIAFLEALLVFSAVIAQMVMHVIAIQTFASLVQPTLVVC